MTLTLHYVNKFFELVNLTLSTSHFPDRHQAIVLLPFIESLLDTFGLSQKNIYMVTDAGNVSNFVFSTFDFFNFLGERLQLLSLLLFYSFQLQT